MSLRTISLSALPLARANARTLSTTAVYRKSVVDQVKDAAQTVSVAQTREREGSVREERLGNVWRRCWAGQKYTASAEEGQREGEIGRVRNESLELGRGRGS